MAKTYNILIVEDNPGDIFLMKKSLEAMSFDHNLEIATDGRQALEYLYNTASTSADDKPDIILLDLNLPKVDGREILYRIKQHEGLKTIPVVMFSSSEAAKDVVSSYDLHANCYVVKPYDFDAYSIALQNIFAFWTNIARLPGQTNPS